MKLEWSLGMENPKLVLTPGKHYSVMFLHNLALAASLLQEMHYDSAHKKRCGTAFICRIAIVVTSWPA